MSGVEENADDPMIVRAMDEGKFVRVNDSFKAKVGFDATELAEKPFLDWIAPCDRAIVLAALEHDERSFFARHITRDGGTLQLGIQVAEHEEGLFVLGRCAKVSTQLESDEVRSAEATVLGTLDAIARIIEEQNTGFKCSILLVAEGRFVFGAGPSLPEDYNSAVIGYAVGPTVGSCGTAIFWNIPVIVEDIQADPLWAPLAEPAKKAGVAACWSHPFINSAGKVLGALALYSPEPRTPTPEQFRQLKAAARITGLAVERGRAEEALKRADEATKVARNQLQATLNALPDLLFEVDSEGRIFSYHTHRGDLLAAPPEAFMGKRFADVLPPDAADASQRAIDEAAHNGFSYGETYRLALPQGEHWFELSVAPLHADAKSDQRFVVISRDITARKAIEAARDEALNRLQKIASRVPGMVYQYRLRPDGRACFPFVSDAIRDILHLDPEDVREDASRVFEVIHPDDVAGFVASIQTSAQTLTHWRAEFRVRFADGTERWLFANALPEREADGAVLWHGFTTDVTERKRAEETIARSAEESRILLNTIQTQIWYLTDDHTYGAVNQAHAEFNGLQVEDMAFENMYDIFPEDVVEVCRQSNVEVFTTGKPVRSEEWVPHVSGERRLISILKSPRLRADGTVEYVVCAAEDITEQRRAEDALREQRDFAESLIETAQAIILVLDTEGRIVRFNPFMEHLAGYGLDEVKGKDWFETFLKPDDKSTVASLFQQAVSGIQTRGNVNSIVTKDGRTILVEWNDKTLKAKDGRTTGLLVIGQDITEREAYKRQIERLAYYDALTALPNRRLLADRLHQSMAQTQRGGRRLAVGFLDLDGFKAINDCQGHDVGDQVLITVAERMQAILREGDTLARLGGDEFAVVLIDLADFGACVPLLDRLLAAAAEPVQVGDLLVRVSISLGVTFYPQSAEVDADQLLRQADQAMYQAKLSGKNRYCFFDAEQDQNPLVGDFHGNHPEEQQADH